MIINPIPQYFFFAIFSILVSDVGKLSVMLLMMNVWCNIHYLTLNLTLNLPTSDTKMSKSTKMKYCGIGRIRVAVWAEKRGAGDCTLLVSKN